MSSPDRRRRWPAGASLAILALVAAMAVPGPAHAAGGPAAELFGLTPSPAPGGQPRQYFSLTVAPGRSHQDTAIISNDGTSTERLKVTVSRGATAGNSGSAYEGVAGRCTGTSCWLAGLPRTVTLGPGVREILPFRVAVPPGTRPAQYLAGITAESAIVPRSVIIRSNGRTAARAVIISKVTVGVAVTVGRLSRMRTLVRISPVSAGWIGSTPRLSIPVRNVGQTFARATGNISCLAGGRRRSYQVIMETVLPGDGAVLPVNAPGLSSGHLPCRVRLRDGTGSTVAWSGIVNLRNRKVTRTYHLSKGVYVSLPQATVPPWTVALIVIGALILASLLGLLLVRRRQAARPADLAASHRTAALRRRAWLGRRA